MTTPSPSSFFSTSRTLPIYTITNGEDAGVSGWSLLSISIKASDGNKYSMRVDPGTSIFTDKESAIERARQSAARVNSVYVDRAENGNIGPFLSIEKKNGKFLPVETTLINQEGGYRVQMKPRFLFQEDINSGGYDTFARACFIGAISVLAKPCPFEPRFFIDPQEGVHK